MMSPKQTPANWPSSNRSTAPKSKKAKARSSTANSLMHGLATEQILLPGEDGREFEEFATKIIEELQPRSELERVLAERVATLSWRLKRVPSMEAAVIQARDTATPEREAASQEQAARRDHLHEMASRYLLKDRKEPPGAPAAAAEAAEETEPTARPESEPPDARKILGSALINDSENGDALGKILRQETALNNTLAKTVSMLTTLQTARLERG